MSARGLQIGVLSYLDKDGLTLLIRKDSPGHYMHGYCVAPGGKRKENEALSDTCIRETQEETGIIPLNPVLKGVISFPDNGDSPFGMEWLCFVFVFHEYSGEMLRKGPEGAVFAHRSTELTSLGMWPGDHLFTPLVFEPGFFFASFEYHGGHLVSHTINRLSGGQLRSLVP